jgi:hypothetical protein
MPKIREGARSRHAKVKNPNVVLGHKSGQFIENFLQHVAPFQRPPRAMLN